MGTPGKLVGGRDARLIFQGVGSSHGSRGEVGEGGYPIGYSPPALARVPQNGQSLGSLPTKSLVPARLFFYNLPYMQQELHDQITATLYEKYRTGEWHARRGLEQDFRCAYCELDYLGTYNDYRSAELDHITPLSAGGEHAFENIAVCCRTCNLLKSTYVPNGKNRTEQILDTREHIQTLRARHEAELNEVRMLVRGGRLTD